MIKRIKLGLILTLALLILTACGAGQPDMDDATAFGENFLSTMAVGDYETGYDMFHPSFVARVGLTAEQMTVVIPPVTFHSFDYAAGFHELEDVDGSVYTVVRMDGTLTSKVGIPLHLILDVVAEGDSFLIDGWIIDIAEVDEKEIKNAAQFVMLSLYLSDFPELEKWSSDNVSIEGAQAAFPPAFIDRFDVIDALDISALTESTGLLPLQVVDVILQDGQGVRIALFWSRQDNAWKLHGVYSCPAGGFGGVCDLDRTGNE